MKLCNPCRIDKCAGLPTDCQSLPAGGFSQIWLVNACDIERTFSPLDGFARGFVNDVTLATNTFLRRFDFRNEIGAQINAVPTQLNPGQNAWQVNAILPLPSLQRESQTFARKIMNGARVLLIGKHKDGHYYVFGSPDEPLSFDGNANAGNAGRVSSDQVQFEISLGVTSSDAYYELLAGTDNDAIETRLELTRTLIDGLEKCPCELLLTLVSGTAPTFENGDTAGTQSTATVNLDRDNLSGDVTIGQITSNLPTGVTIVSPTFPLGLGGSANSLDVVFEYDGSATAAETGDVTLEASGLSCDTGQVVIPIEIT